MLSAAIVAKGAANSRYMLTRSEKCAMMYAVGSFQKQKETQKESYRVRNHFGFTSFLASPN